jgi:hypothetical protein
MTLTTQMFVFAHGKTSHFEVSEELVVLRLMQDQTKGPNFIQTLVCSLKKQDLQVSKLVCIVTEAAAPMIGSKYGMIPPL